MKTNLIAEIIIWLFFKNIRYIIMYLYTYNFTKSALLWVGVSQPSHLVCVCGGAEPMSGQ